MLTSRQLSRLKTKISASSSVSKQDFQSAVDVNIVLNANATTKVTRGF